MSNDHQQQQQLQHQDIPTPHPETKVTTATTISTPTTSCASSVVSTMGTLLPLPHHRQHHPQLLVPPPYLVPTTTTATVSTNGTNTTAVTTSDTVMIPQPPHQNQQPVQLHGIVFPHPHDVLCGRGGQSNVHPGNTQWRMLVSTNKELYVTLPKKQKMMLSQSIVNAVRSQTPSGRFLQKDVHTDLWYDVGDKRAQEKTSQALREGAPEIRTKLNVTGGCTPINHFSSSSINRNNTKGPNMAAASNDPGKGQSPQSPVSSIEATTAGEDLEIIKETTKIHRIPAIPKNRTTTEDDIDDIADLVPLGLGHATSKEQMPPPLTIPSSSAVATTRTSTKNQPTTRTSTKNQPATTTKPAIIASITSTVVMDERSDSHRHIAAATTTMVYDDGEVPLPPPPFPKAMSFHQEAHAGCSFGSMGLMSDVDQARLMHSFMSATATTTTATSLSSSSSAVDDFRTNHHTNGHSGGTYTAATNNHNTHLYHTHTAEHGYQRPVDFASYTNGTGDGYQTTNQQRRSTFHTPQQYNSYHPSQNSTYNTHQQQQQFMSSPSPYFHDSQDGTNYYTTTQQYHTHPPIHDVVGCCSGGTIPQPVDGGLEPVGLSIGSMMSIGTYTKLEDAGFSFGSAMSCTPIPVNTTGNYMARSDEPNTSPGDKQVLHFNHASTPAQIQPPDGGLQDVGTSLGSLSLADGERERIIAEAQREMAATSNNDDNYAHQDNRPPSIVTSNTADTYDAATIPTTLLHQQKSRGSLLTCGDDSDDTDDKGGGDETTSAEARSQKGTHEWNMLQATLALQDEGIRNSVSVPPMFVLNPSDLHRQQQQHQGSCVYHYDAPTLDRDYSQMSAISVGEDFEPPMSPIAIQSTTTATMKSHHISPAHGFNYHTSSSIESDPNWDHYESSVRQEVLFPPPVLKKTFTNRY